MILGQAPAGELPDDVDLAQITLPLQVPVSLPSELAHRRPDILAAEARLHAATSAVGVAQSNLYPKIQLSAYVGQQSLKADQLFDRASNAWSIISGLTAPIFDGGTLRAEKRAAVEAMHASAATYEQTVLQAFAQVADLLEGLDHDAEQLDAQDHAQQAAQSSLDLARISFKEGNAGVLQVLDAERSVSTRPPWVCEGRGAALSRHCAALLGAGRHQSVRPRATTFSRTCHSARHWRFEVSQRMF